MKKAGFLLAAILVWAVCFLDLTPAHAAPPICTVASTGFNPSSPTAGTPVDVTGSIDQSSTGSGCQSGFNNTPVTDGSLEIQYRQADGTADGGAIIGVSCAIGSPNKVCTGGINIGGACNAPHDCDTSTGSGDGVCTVATFETFAGPAGNTTGSLTQTFDTTGLGGQTFGFRTIYNPPPSGSYKAATSPCIDLVIGNAPPQDPPSCTPGATISASLVNGDGTPTPDNTSNPDGPWTFRITVTACGPLTGVTAQGGSNGWAPTALDGSGLSTVTGTAAFRKINTKNQVILWQIGDMVDGQVANLDVTVNGNIPKNSPCGQVRYLNGPWSALFSLDGGVTFQKSDYTGRESVFVDTDGDGTTCEP